MRAFFAPVGAARGRASRAWSPTRAAEPPARAAEPPAPAVLPSDVLHARCVQRGASVAVTATRTAGASAAQEVTATYDGIASNAETVARGLRAASQVLPFAARPAVAGDGRASEGAEKGDELREASVALMCDPGLEYVACTMAVRGARGRSGCRRKQKAVLTWSQRHGKPVPCAGVFFPFLGTFGRVTDRH